jgi:hypothetical protein
MSNVAAAKTEAIVQTAVGALRLAEGVREREFQEAGVLFPCDLLPLGEARHAVPSGGTRFISLP